MPVHYPPLSPSQKRYIEANRKTMSLRQLAEAQHTSYARVRDYVNECGIIKAKKPARPKKERPSPGYFDYRQFSNWLVG